jgi:hypothetical protein
VAAFRLPAAPHARAQPYSRAGSEVQSQAPDALLPDLLTVLVTPAISCWILGPLSSPLLRCSSGVEIRTGVYWFLVLLVSGLSSLWMDALRVRIICCCGRERIHPNLTFTSIHLVCGFVRCLAPRPAYPVRLSVVG